MSMRTSIEVAKDGSRRVYHARTAPPDRRTDEAKRGQTTHAWTHSDTPQQRALCAACTSGKLPEEMRRR